VISFTVSGAPVPQQRPRASVRKGSTKVRMYDPKKCVYAKSRVALMAKIAMRGGKPMTGPVSATIVFYMPCPKSAHRKRTPAKREWHTSVPDVDNLSKLILDGCNKIVFADDGQVAKLRAKKIRCAQGESARTEVTFTELPELEE